MGTTDPANQLQDQRHAQQRRAVGSRRATLGADPTVRLGHRLHGVLDIQLAAVCELSQPREGKGQGEAGEGGGRAAERERADRSQFFPGCGGDSRGELDYLIDRYPVTAIQLCRFFLSPGGE